MMMGSNGQKLLTVWALLIVCLLNGPSWQAAATTNTNDLNALQALKSQWNKPGSNMPQNWNGNDPCGSSGEIWTGVSCDPTSTNVVSLYLLNYNLTGGIPPAIGDLASLMELDLSNNGQLGGPIPSQLGNLKSLTSLALIGCGLAGVIPAELGKLVNLQFLALNQNGFIGSIPPEIGNLGKMTWFDISENSITGSLPTATATSVGLDNLTSILHFHFYNNSLSGALPQEIFNLPSLLHMLLSFNQFQGTIPNATLANAKHLSILSLDYNFLSGSLPQQLDQIAGLTELHLNNNNFTGTLPNLSALTSLGLLDVGHNPFDQQEIPAWTYSLNAAQTIAMPLCNLNGTLDSRIFSLPAIQTLDLSNNVLSGSVQFVSPSSTLVMIDLENNNFGGIDNGTQFPGSLLLYGNPLICNANLYSGSKICVLSSNGPPVWSPTGNASCATTCEEDQALNPNLCSCAFPLVCHMQLTAPTFRSVNSTVISDIINQFARAFIKLDVISVDSQVYIGDANFTTDGRMLFDLSFFPLSGDSLNSTVVSFITHELNSQLLPLTEGPYIMRNATLPPNSSSSSKSKTSVGLIVGIVVAVVVVLVIIALIALYAIRQKKRADKAEVSRPFASWGTITKESGEAPELKGARWFSLAELRKATDNFSEDNEIGAGGYGKVYRAVLPNGRVVAVKRADQSSVQGAVEFKNEIELLSRVHHKNLVGLVGFCYENGEQALVYEYIPNGTLREHLLGHYEKPLSWEMRVAIALGSAKGLTYLHELANPPIIHRDIKSGNILLDENMIAKVADFGLSKLAPGGQQKDHISTQVKGTLGYLDPEYYMTNQLSEKSDVYSFGVVLLEILSARPPIERGRYIVREVRNALNKGGIKALEPLLDPLLGDYPQKQLDAFLDVALLCVEEVAAGRPTMNVVVKKLEVIAGQSRTSSGVHITVEPQKGDGIYEKDYLQGVDDRSFQYSGASFTSNVPIEPK